MDKTHIATIGFLGLAAIGYSGFIAYEHSQLPTRWRLLRPLDVPLKTQTNNTFQVGFEAGYTEPHYLELAFPKDAATPGANSMVTKWNDPRLGKAEMPSGPDLQWQLFDKGKLVGSGTGEQISAWVGQTIAIGQFNLKSGHHYTLVTKIGPRFQEFMSCEPRLGVEVSTATVSIGLAIDREYGNSYALGVGSIGLILLLVATGNYWRLKLRSAQQHG
jgi:hypothetical protein